MQRDVRASMMEMARAKQGKPPAKKKPPKFLSDYGLYMGLEAAMESFNAWVRSGYVVMAFAGGWLDQPEWWRHDMKVLYHEYTVAAELVMGKKGAVDSEQHVEKPPPPPARRVTLDDLGG